MFGMQDMRIDDVGWALCAEDAWVDSSEVENLPKAKGDGELGPQQMSASTIINIIVSNPSRLSSFQLF